MHHIFEKSSFTIIFLLVLSACAFFYKLGDPNFYHTRNESRRAEISREMLETGNWIVPQLEGEAILTKPPLFYWAVALCSLKTGVNEFTARIPSAIAGMGTILFTFLLGSLLFNRKIGFWSALILMVANMFMGQARYAEMESMLTFFITGSIYFFFKGYYEPSRAKIWFSLFFAMMGLGTMTKGPFAFTFPLIPIIAYLFIYRDQKLLISKPFLFGIIFFFIILLPWAFLILNIHPEFALVAIWETIGRVATGFAHRRPFYYYFDQMSGALFPWIFFLPFSIGIAFSKRLGHWRKENVFLLLWFLGNIIFLSLSKSKRDFYLLPVIPAIALLTGSTWEAIWQWAGEKTDHISVIIQRICFGVGFTLTGISLITGDTFAFNIPSSHFPHNSPFLFFAGLSLMVVAGIKRFFPSLETCKISLTTLIILTFTCYYSYFTYTVPIRNVDDSGKHFYVLVSKLINPLESLAFANIYENYTFNFYAHRPVITLTNKDEVLTFMSAPGKRYLVLTEKNFRKLPPVSWKVKLKSKYAEHRSSGGYLLLCNQ